MALVTTYGLRVLGAIVILLIGWMISRVLYNGIRRLCERSTRLDRTVTLFLANGARYLILVFTFSAVLSTFGIATTSFVAVLGALGIAVGLALQGTLSNLAAGIMLVLFRPFHIGDRIETGGVIGTTREINLFYSELDTDDNVRVIIPNGKLWGEIVKIPSRNDTERVEVKFTRPLTDDVETAIDRLRELVQHDNAHQPGRPDRHRYGQRGQLRAGGAPVGAAARCDAGPLRSQSRGEGRIPAPAADARGGARRRLALASLGDGRSRRNLPLEGCSVRPGGRDGVRDWRCPWLRRGTGEPARRCSDAGG